MPHDPYEHERPESFEPATPLDAVGGDGDRIALASHVGVRRYGPRKAVFRQGEHCGKIFEVLEGMVLLFRTLPDGRRQILEIFGPGMLLGLAVEQAKAARAETLTCCRLRIHGRSHIERSDRLKLLATRQYEASIATLSDLAVGLGRKTAPERIGMFVLKLAGIGDDAGNATQQNECRLPLTQVDIADHLGLSIETVCREFAKLKKAGLIVVNRRGWLRIVDVASLARWAEQVLPPNPHRPSRARMQSPHRARPHPRAKGLAA